MKLRLDPFAPNGVSIDNSTVTVAGGSTTTGGSSTPVTIAGEDYLSLTAQEITANPIDLDNLSATGTPSGATFLRGDNTWATPAGSGDVSKVGTPVNNQIGVWTGDGTIEGDAALTFDTATDTLSTVTVTASGAVTGSNLSGTNTGDQTSIVGITGTLAQFNTALTGADFASGGGTATGTNTGDQTSIVGITGTKAQYDTSVTDGNFLYVGDVSQYTDEMAQDAVGGMVDTTLVYNDATPSLVRAALTGDVTASAGSNTTAIAAGVIVNADINGSAAIDATKIADGSVTSTEFQYINTLSSNAQTQIDGKQPLDSDLTTIAGLTATTDNFIQSKSSAWASRTPAQVAADLAVEVGKLLMPVGFVMASSSSTNPGTSLGFGTWAAYGAGRVMVGKAGAGTFATGGATGGAETHTLDTTEIPAHTHGLPGKNSSTAGTQVTLMSSSTTGSNSTKTSDSTGGGGAHNNLQPYIVTYLWERTV